MINIYLRNRLPVIIDTFYEILLVTISQLQRPRLDARTVQFYPLYNL